MTEVGAAIDDGTRGPSIQVASGAFFYVLDPRPEEVFIEDIAQALSNICRYTGHVKRFYSVADHSRMVSRIVPDRFALWGLLHDAAEAYIGDISRPMKQALNMLAPGMLKHVEHKVEKAIAERFGLTWPMPPVVKDADNVALATEKRDLMVGNTTWANMPWPMAEKVMPLEPKPSEWAFLERFEELTA